MSDRTSFYPELAKKIAPAEGRVAVLLPGLGAVSTTLIAGVHLIRKGLAKPFGSVTQMQKLRLGKRSAPRHTLVKDLVPLSKLEDLVFGGWDIFADNAYESAVHAGVLGKEMLEPVRTELESVRPMPAVFDREWVKNLDGPNVKKAPTKMHLAEALIQDIADFRKSSGAARAVMVWCGSTEVYAQPKPVHETLAAFEKGLRDNSPDIPPSMIYAYAAIASGTPYANGAPNLSVDVPALIGDGESRSGVPIAGKDFKTGQTLMKTIIAPGLKARMLGLQGWFSTNILGNRDGEVLDDPGLLPLEGGQQDLGPRRDPPARALSGALRRLLPQGPHRVLPAARRRQGGLGQHRHRRLARPADADQDRLPLPRLDPRRAGRARPAPVPRPGRPRRPLGDPGVAVVLLQVADVAGRTCGPSTTSSSST